jgi:hypothetical protein
MFVWDCTWGTRTAAVEANTQIGARKAARKVWGRTVRRPEDHEIQCFIRHHEDGTPVKPEPRQPSPADLVTQRVYSAPVARRQQEDWQSISSRAGGAIIRLGKRNEMAETKLTRAELFYLRGVVEMDAHDGNKNFARIAMELLRKLDRMRDEADQSETAMLNERTQTHK